MASHHHWLLLFLTTLASDLLATLAKSHTGGIDGALDDSVYESADTGGSRWEDEVLAEKERQLQAQSVGGVDVGYLDDSVYASADTDGSTWKDQVSAQKQPELEASTSQAPTVDPSADSQRELEKLREQLQAQTKQLEAQREQLAKEGHAPKTKRLQNLHGGTAEQHAASPTRSLMRREATLEHNVEELNKRLNTIFPDLGHEDHHKPKSRSRKPMNHHKPKAQGAVVQELSRFDEPGNASQHGHNAVGAGDTNNGTAVQSDDPGGADAISGTSDVDTEDNTLSPHETGNDSEDEGSQDVGMGGDIVGESDSNPITTGSETDLTTAGASLPNLVRNLVNYDAQRARGSQKSSFIKELAKELTKEVTASQTANHQRAHRRKHVEHRKPHKEQSPIVNQWVFNMPGTGAGPQPPVINMDADSSSGDSADDELVDAGKHRQANEEASSFLEIQPNGRAAHVGTGTEAEQDQ